MPTGPKGQKRPADVVGAAIMVARISVGEIEDTPDPKESASAAATLGRLGGKARAKNLSPEQRAEAARKAAAGRWKTKA